MADGVNEMTNATSLVELLGPLAAVIEDQEVVEISCNPDGEVFVERFGSGPRHWGSLEPARTDRFVRWCASWSATELVFDRPILSGRVPRTAHRIEAVMPPVTGGACFSIRRHRDTVPSLEECVPEEVPRRLLMDAIAERKNVLIAGATGAGKTTLLNACLGQLARIAPETRLLTIEDTPEIRAPFANAVALVTADGVMMDRLLVSSLRLAPDRIVVGEVREGSVLLTLIKAWNTGHPGGLVTLHANSASEVMARLSLLATEVMTADPVPILMQATDLIVFVHRDTGRPVLSSIRAAVRDSDGATRMENCYEHPG
ncbi:MAG: conjugal transfer protein TrbB [Boseongicola sp. SB0667_bin_21]|nr:conjugal transfer protein TrbB [Boseongicola sp. SB0667_bin_21]